MLREFEKDFFVAAPPFCCCARERTRRAGGAESCRPLGHTPPSPSLPSFLSTHHHPKMKYTLAAAALIAIASTTSGVEAQSSSFGGSLGSISSNCQQAALTLLGSEFATCSNLQGLLGIATSTSSSSSIVDPSQYSLPTRLTSLLLSTDPTPQLLVNTWLGGLCDRGNCSDSAIKNATNVVDSGCSSDLADGNVVISTLRGAIENFNGEKEAVCLRSTNSSGGGGYCISSLLGEIQNATDTTLSIDSLASLNLTAFEEIPAATVCTDCNSALLYKFAQTGSLNQSEIQQAQKFCSDDKFGTEVPSTVSSEATSNSSTTTTSSSGGGTNAATGLRVPPSSLAAAVAVLGSIGVSTLFFA